MFLTEIFTRDKHKLSESLKKGPIPHHIAIIMDGNRRWAKKRFLPTVAGHWAGASTLKNIVRAASDLGVRALTVYAFSTENWMRSKGEIEALFKVLESYLLQEKEGMIEEGVRLKSVGNIEKFPESLISVIKETEEATAVGDKIDLVLALNYGSRDEIRRAVTSIVEDCMSHKVKKEEISEDLIASYLDTAFLKDPDLLIRTSGEMRLSNFLLWQLSYTEVYVTNVLWPDFSKEHLVEAIKEYQNREIRRGV